MLHCTLLHCVLYCTVLYCTVLHCTDSLYTVALLLHCTWPALHLRLALPTLVKGAGHLTTPVQESPAPASPDTEPCGTTGSEHSNEPE